MRIIGTIDHPTLKISVFKNEGRTSVKFENSGYEIACKFGDDDRFQTAEDIAKLLDEPFLAAVNAELQHMHAARLAALKRLFPATAESEFETII
jgi:hypothetical protein